MMQHIMILLFEVFGIMMVRIGTLLYHAVIWVHVIVVLVVVMMVVAMLVLLLVLLITIEMHAMLRSCTIFHVPCVLRCTFLLTFLTLNLSALPCCRLEWSNLPLRPAELQHAPRCGPRRTLCASGAVATCSPPGAPSLRLGRLRYRRLAPSQRLCHCFRRLAPACKSA